MLSAVKAMVGGRGPDEDFNKPIREAGALLVNNNSARAKVRPEAFAITGKYTHFCATALCILTICLKACRFSRGVGSKSQSGMDLMGHGFESPRRGLGPFFKCLANPLRVLVNTRQYSPSMFRSLFREVAPSAQQRRRRAHGWRQQRSRARIAQLYGVGGNYQLDAAM